METAAFPVQIGLDRNHPMTETDIYKNKLHDDIGPNWKDLARELGYNQATIDAIENEKVNCNKECCIELLVRWLRREGRCATAGKLADALTSAGLKNLADDLIYGPSRCQCSCCQKARMGAKCLVESNDPYNVSKCEQLIGEMSEQLNDKLASLTQEVYKMSNRIIELEDNLSRAKQKCRDTEEENLSLRAKNKELEDTRQLEREVVDNTESLDTGKAPVVSPDTDDAARETHIGKRLEELNQHLQTYVTSPLQVPEVKQDKLKTPVKLDLLTRLSESLQELYSETLIIVTETCKCSEDLKREFYDFAYHGLRAEHNELVHRVSDLESALTEMSVDEKKEFERLQGFQVNRQRQCQRLDKLWRGLFSPPERLPKAPWSLPTAANGKTSKKKLLRRTDPGTRPKRTKPRDQPIRSSEAFSASEDDNSEMRLNTKLMKNIFRKKEDENVSSSVPYSLMRDS